MSEGGSERRCLHLSFGIVDHMLGVKGGTLSKSNAGAK